MYGGKNLRKVWRRFLRVPVWIARHVGQNDYYVIYVSRGVPINGGYFSWLRAGAVPRIPSSACEEARLLD